MKYVYGFDDFLVESVKQSTISDLINDFGFFLTLNLSQVTKMGVDSTATNELNDMMSNIRKPIINGMSFIEITKDVNSIYSNPRLTSALLNKIREFILYIEPRIKKFVIDCDFKNNWLTKINKFKQNYSDIIAVA